MPVLIALLLALVGLVPVSGQAASAAPLDLDATDAGWLRARGPLVFAFEEIPPFALVRDGRPQGYSVALLERAAARLGVTMQFRRLPTAAGLAAVRTGEVDGLLNVAMTEARAAYLHFGARSALVEPRIFSHRSGPPLNTLADLAGRRVAVWPAGMTAALIEGLAPPAVAVPVADQRAALRAVASGDAEATIMDLRHGRWLLTEGLITDLVASPRAVAPLRGALFAVARAEERLADLLDRAVAAVPPGEEAALQAYWFGDAAALGQGAPVAPRTVTLSEAERAFLRAHPEVVLGTDARWEPLVFTDLDGRLTGIDVDILDLIGTALGIRFRMTTGVWDDIVRRAEAGAIDGLTASVAHPERRRHFLFTRPYTTMRRAVFVRAGNPLQIHTLADLAGKRVGHQQGNLNDRKFIDQVPGALAVPLPDNEKLINALANGTIDAAVNTDALVFMLARLRRADIVPVIYLPEAVPLVFSIRKDWPELVSAMDKVLVTLSPAERLAIIGRYLPSGPVVRDGVPLTALERAWLEQRGRRLPYCFSPVWRPYDYLEDGNHRGIFREQLDLLGQKLGVTFVPVPSATWPEALAHSRAGECDLLSGAVATPERREWLDFTSPFMQLTHVLVAPAREPFVGGLAALAGRTITVPAGSAIAAELRQTQPGLTLLEVDDLDSAVAAIRAGRAYAALATLEHAADVIQRSAGELRVIAQLPDPYPVSIAVRRDQPVLLGILQKALDSVTAAERDALQRRVTTFTVRQQLDLTRLWPVLAIALTVAGFLLLRQRELTRLNQALREARDAARAAAAAKGRFLATMSHEMRTPMHAMLGMARLCRESGVTPRQRDWLDQLEGAGQALLGLIEDVLDLSRQEAGALRLHPRPFVADDLLTTLASLLAAEARARGLSLTLQIDPAVPARLIGDPERLQQVLLNLAGNALKFTPSGWVRVAMTLQAAGPETVTLGCLVSDSGIGIDAATRARLFTPFTQGDDSLARRHGGAGLGLAISQELVSLMGGQIDCDSAPGQGSRFSFQITCPRDGAAALPWEQDRRLAGRRLLLVAPEATAAALRPLLAACGLLPVTDPLAADLALVVAAGLPPGLPRALPCCWYAPVLDPTADGPPPLPVSRLRLFADLCALLEPDRVAGAAPAGASDPPVTLAGRRLLLAEDHPVSRAYVQEVLRGAGAEVVLAEDGDQAVAQCRGADFDAILMDVSMPGRDGLAATRAIRALGGFAGTPIIALTAHADRDQHAACRAAGMDDHLVKPVTPEALLAALARWLPESAGAHRPAPDPQAPGLVDPALGRAPSGNPALYRRLLRTFADEHWDAPARLTDAAAASDTRTLVHIAHGLAGSAGLVGAIPLEQQAQALLATLERDPAAVGPAVARLTAVLADTLAAIARLDLDPADPSR